MTSEIKVDTISEQTSANGVTIDGLTIKDGNIIGDVALAGTTPTFTVGDGGAEDAALIFDGNAQDFYIALDDSADDLVIGTGSTIGSNAKMVIENGGNVGIGTSSPANTLHVDASGGGTIKLTRLGSSTDAFLRLECDGTNGGIVSHADINLDVGGGDISLKGSGTEYGKFNLSGNSLNIHSSISDGDIVFKGNDGGSAITALTLDMSAAGAATFNAGITVNGTTTVVDDISISGSTPSITLTDTDDNSDCMVYQAAGNLYLEADKNSEASGSFLRIAVDDLDMVHVYNGSTVFNESSRDQDFRVESNGNANMLFIDGGNDKVGIGTSSPSELLEISSSSDPAIKLNGGASGNPLIDFSQNGTQKAYIQYLDSGDLWTFQSDGGTRFLTGGSTERLKIDLEGNLVFNDGQNDCNFRIKSDNLADMLFVDAGNDRVGIGSDAPDYTFQVDAPSSVANYAANIRSLHTSTPYGLFVKFTSASPDGSDNQFYVAQDSGTTRFKVNSDGDVQNHDNSYGALSDERIKQDIRDSNSQWNDIKAIKVRNFKKKDDVRQYGDNAWEQIGVVAQELETVSPKLIRHNNPNASDILSDSSFGTLWTADDAETQDAVLYTSEDQEVIDGIKNVGDIKTSSTKQIGDIKEIKEQVKSVNYSVLYMKAIKALQEAQTRIEILETKVEALEG